MKFMREAIANKRQEAKENAESLLKDLAHIDQTLSDKEESEQSEAEEAEEKKPRTAEEQAKLRAEVDAILADEDECHDSVAVQAPSSLNIKSKRLAKAVEESK